jgi:anti-sigma factor RsiW
MNPVENNQKQNLQRLAAIHLRQNEDRILDLVEGLLSPSESRVVREHLANCAECRAFADKVQALDQTLQQSIRLPTLSETFNLRVRQKIEAQSAIDPESSYEVLRSKLLTEFDQSLKRLRRQFLHSSQWLEALGYAWAAALGAYLLLELVTPFIS